MGIPITKEEYMEKSIEEYEAERADDRVRIRELEAERDADRKREYGYSQQTVDALTVERDNLEAENKRLAALNDMFPQEIAQLEDRVSAEYEAERADDRARIKALEAENERLMEALKYIAFTTPGPTMKTHSEAAEQALKEASHEST